VSNQLILNVSWMRPEYPQGNVKFYHLLVSSAQVLSIEETKIFPQKHGEDVVFEHQFVIDLVVDESLNVSVSVLPWHPGSVHLLQDRVYCLCVPDKSV
jgi:hypothetical protein